MRLCLYMVCVAAVSVAAACEPMRSSSRAEPEDEASEEAVSRAEYDESERTQQRTGKTREVEPLPEEQRADAPLDTPRAPLRADAGVFSDLDGRVSFPFPAWLGGQGIIVGKRPGGGHLFAMLDGRAIGFGHADMGELKLVENTSANDADGDGIPNQLDIVIGAEKAALNAAPYQGGYKGMSYPGGDVPRTEGVCTDVLVRAIRNAGIDLQKELHEDIQAKPSAYHMVETPDPNIDQRRVRTLLPYFERRWQARPTDTDALTSWLPGDVVFMNTMGDDRPDHVGIVSSRQGDSGLPLIINNWTNGYHTKAMDLLSFVPVTHRFRLPADDVQWSPATRLDDALAQHGVSLEEAREQAILVLAESEGPMAKLQRFERGELAHWRVVSDPMEARIGGRGLGLGLGVATPVRTSLRPKVEGDRRAPAGLFELGFAFGSQAKPYEGGWPWRRADEEARWVDDPDSPAYNTWQTIDADVEWSSAEVLEDYRLALVVEHNAPDPKAGAGSAIFLHAWDLDAGGTLGCTGIAYEQMLALLEWLRTDADPILVQLPTRE